MYSVRASRMAISRRLVYLFLMLLLKKHLVDLVRAGKKRQTLRFWTRPIVRVGQISYTPGLGRLRITAITVINDLNDLTEVDAQADGFSDLAALLAELHQIYPIIPPPGKTLYRIEFQWPAEPERAESTAETASAGGEADAETADHHPSVRTLEQQAAAAPRVKPRVGAADLPPKTRRASGDADPASRREQMLQLRDWLLAHPPTHKP